MTTKSKRGGSRNGAGRKSIDGVIVFVKNLTLDQESIDFLTELGNGQLSFGVRLAASKLKYLKIS